MRNLVVILSFILVFSCQYDNKEKPKKKEDAQAIEVKTAVETDTLVLERFTEYSNKNNNEVEYSFVIKNDTLSPKFLVRGNEEAGFHIRHYPVPADDFVWLHKLAKHLALKNTYVNSISLGKLVTQPFSIYVTKAYRAKHGKDVSLEHYASLEAIIMDSKLVSTLNEAIEPLNAYVIGVDVEKVFYMKSHGVEMLNSMVWLNLTKTD